MRSANGFAWLNPFGAATIGFRGVERNIMAHRLIEFVHGMISTGDSMPHRTRQLGNSSRFMGY